MGHSRGSRLRLAVGTDRVTVALKLAMLPSYVGVTSLGDETDNEVLPWGLHSRGWKEETGS